MHAGATSLTASTTSGPRGREVLRAQMDGGAGRVVVVGAGFIGLEFAAVAAQRGLEVTVIDVAQRPMQRVLSPSCPNTSPRSTRISAFSCTSGKVSTTSAAKTRRVEAVVGNSGTTYPCDFAVVGLGVATDLAIAASAGIDSEGGILVDKYCETSAAHVYAIGDLAVFPSTRFGQRLRLESVQNATDMAKMRREDHHRLPDGIRLTPWFWSNQGPAKLQIAGLTDPEGHFVERGDRSLGKFSQFNFRNDRLIAVESVNSPETMWRHANYWITEPTSQWIKPGTLGST